MAAGVSSADLDFQVHTFYANQSAFGFDLSVPSPEAPRENTVYPFSKSSDESPTSFWAKNLEQFLLDDDVDDGEEGSSPTEGFFADVFARYDGNEETIEESRRVEEEEEEEVVVAERNQVGDGVNGRRSKEDTIDKKRMRQLRNRDSAMKSRERKKIYVKSLEMKGKSLEAQCKHLEYLLHCCRAENIFLRNCLQKDRKFGVYRTRQESAVLFEESLLLGSVLWVVITVFLFLAPNLLAWSPPAGAAAGARVGQGASQKLMFMGAKGSLNERLGVGLERASVFMRRRYRALKPKMKILVTCH